MPNKIENKEFYEHRALFGSEYIQLENCKFCGADDTTSALMSCGIVEAENCCFDSRYPLWHDYTVTLNNCELTENCRAALWYSRNVNLVKTKLHGEKALRECKSVVMRDCDISSAEFGWSARGVRLTDSAAAGEYFMMRATDLAVRRIKFKGKYAFQYVHNAIVMDSTLNTQAAFWHSQNTTVENCIIIGEYLGWYSKNLTFKNCTIIGKQPLCNCQNLKLVDCVMQDTDMAFERSEVYAVLRGKIDSIKNPTKGVIKAPEVGEIIRDDRYAKCKVLVDPYLLRGRKND